MSAPFGTKFGIGPTCSDLCGNGHQLNKLVPLYLGASGGGVGGPKFKKLVNLPNRSTVWHQIWYMSADLSGNGHRLKQLSP